MAYDEPLDVIWRDYRRDPYAVARVREIHRLFRDALRRIPGVVDVVLSGSVGRNTSRLPIHDLDLILVVDPAVYPDWGTDGSSARRALEYVRGCVARLLGETGGEVAHQVTSTRVLNHVVNCTLKPDSFWAPRDGVTDEVTVDVMPAIRVKGGLKVPAAREGRWETVDPEFLIREVAARQAACEWIDEMVRLVKDWAIRQGLDIKSLAVEVLVLRYAPNPGLWPMPRAEALHKFFVAAGAVTQIEDPAGRCGAIQPDLDMTALRARLAEAADISGMALAAERAGDLDAAERYWLALMGAPWPVAERSRSTTWWSPAAWLRRLFGLLFAPVVVTRDPARSYFVPGRVPEDVATEATAGTWGGTSYGPEPGPGPDAGPDAGPNGAPPSGSGPGPGGDPGPGPDGGHDPGTDRKAPGRRRPAADEPAGARRPSRRSAAAGPKNWTHDPTGAPRRALPRRPRETTTSSDGARAAAAAGSALGMSRAGPREDGLDRILAAAASVVEGRVPRGQVLFGERG